VRSDTRLALQATIVAAERGADRAFMEAAFRARWAEGRDLGEPATVAALLGAVGLDGRDALTAAESPELAERLEAENRAAIERGVFGVPTVFVEARMFWGNDRFELARFYLDGGQSAGR
jgi:2-hydroxychromene-2-carboxylate isomerase